MIKSYPIFPQTLVLLTQFMGPKSHVRFCIIYHQSGFYRLKSIHIFGTYWHETIDQLSSTEVFFRELDCLMSWTNRTSIGNFFFLPWNRNKKTRIKQMNELVNQVQCVMTQGNDTHFVVNWVGALRATQWQNMSVMQTDSISLPLIGCFTNFILVLNLGQVSCLLRSPRLKMTNRKIGKEAVRRKLGTERLLVSRFFN